MLIGVSRERRSKFVLIDRQTFMSPHRSTPDNSDSRLVELLLIPKSVYMDSTLDYKQYDYTLYGPAAQHYTVTLNPSCIFQVARRGTRDGTSRIALQVCDATSRSVPARDVAMLNVTIHVHYRFPGNEREPTELTLTHMDEYTTPAFYTSPLLISLNKQRPCTKEIFSFVTTSSVRLCADKIKDVVVFFSVAIFRSRYS